MTRTCPICNNELQGDVATCPQCGYRFPGSTQKFEPLKLGDDGSLPEEAAEQRYDLRVVRGPQTGVDIALASGTLSVGRDPQCDIFLNDMTVSRRHAEIEVGKRGCVIRDCNSFNGVWVNDRSEKACLLKSGDIIQIGAFCLVYRERP